MEWHRQYKDKLRTADEVAAMVKSGEQVIVGCMSEPRALGEALARRVNELEGVTILQPIITQHFDWFNPGYEKAFNVVTGFAGRPAYQAVREGRLTNTISSGIQPTIPQRLPADWCTYDWFFIPLSPPDDNGYLSYGSMLWMSRILSRTSKRVVAEVVPGMVRPFGEGYIHISEVDYIVEGSALPAQWMPQREITDIDAQRIEAIGSLVASLINDGDTIQMGTGTVSSTIMPYFEDKHDLGFHSELSLPGIVPLVKSGVINGRRKSREPGKVVATCFVVDEEDFAYIDSNPGWELRDWSYTNHPMVIAQQDNMTCINQVLTMDLTGQSTAESIGPRIISGAGGAVLFGFGCSMARGGKNIQVVESTNPKTGESNIVSQLPPHTVTTLPRGFCQFVVSEFGIASMAGKTERQRIEEMIAIAHPDHRAGLREEARKVWLP